MKSPLARLRALTGQERKKAALLFAWFFLTVTTLWLLKPVRSASLLAHLGADELPYVRLGSVATVALVVVVYSAVVDRLERVTVARGANFLFAGLLVLFWLALFVGGSALGAQRWFVWAVFILVDVFSTVMIGIFWTYANDVVSPTRPTPSTAPSAWAASWAAWPAAPSWTPSWGPWGRSTSCSSARSWWPSAASSCT